MRVSFYNGIGQPKTIRTDAIFITDMWHHVAVVKDSTEAKLYLDGRLAGSVSSPGSNNFVDPKSLSIGAYADRDPGQTGFAAYQSFLGEIDEVRISRTKRYTANFTPRAYPFNYDADILGLYHLDGGFVETGANRNLDGQGVGSGISFVASTVPNPNYDTYFVASPPYITAGGSITVYWSGIANPSMYDWIALYPQGTPDMYYMAWMYVSCSRTPGTPQSSGSCSFPIPAGIANGTYELRLFANNWYNRLATSNILTTDPPPPTAVISNISIPPCTGSACNVVTTVIINGTGFAQDARVSASGYNDNIQYTEESLTPSGQPYVVIAGRTGTTQIIVDFHDLPCQRYQVNVWNPFFSGVSAMGGGAIFDFPPNFCGRG